MHFSVGAGSTGFVAIGCRESSALTDSARGDAPSIGGYEDSKPAADQALGRARCACGRAMSLVSIVVPAAHL